MPRTSFEDVIALYEADRKLRTLIHDGIERIEVALRARIGELLVSEGSLSYRNKIIFRPNFKHEEWLETADKRVSRAMRRNESIKHYADQYGGQYPFWVLADVLDFSDISKLYEGLKTTDQYKLAEDLGVNIDLNLLSANLRRKTLRSHPLVRWFEQLSIVRNTCAHHGRLWNKSFTPASTNALRTVHGLSTLPDGQSGRIYGTLVLMAFLLRTISPNSSWQGKIVNLLEDKFIPNPIVSMKSMGLPNSWSGSLL
ncbi:Abortive infection bacteriophage resistance protein [Rothia dentocariosa]|nr:Abortive infection bacteriophage resistance protein [Rothia dentocariosa]